MRDAACLKYPACALQHAIDRQSMMHPQVVSRNHRSVFSGWHKRKCIEAIYKCVETVRCNIEVLFVCSSLLMAVFSDVE